MRSKSLLGSAPQPQGARNHCSGVPRSHLALEIPARALATIYYRYAYATLMELLRFAMQKVYGTATIYYESAYATPMELLRFAIEILIPPLLNCYDLLGKSLWNCCDLLWICQCHPYADMYSFLLINIICSVLCASFEIYCSVLCLSPGIRCCVRC